ncbi:MAG: hypothetical protein IKZ74_08535 [Clostridiales bacterium]|nr:hypothetical protein [Clostridiales bacterium]
MPVSVELQDPYSYSIWPIVIVVIIIIVSLAAIVLLSILLKIRRAPAQKAPVTQIFRPKTLADAQKEYLAKIAYVEQQYNNGQMDSRNAHQELSAIVRMFVYDITGVQAQNFSLNELKSYNITSISNLIEEFYAPEFAERSDKQTEDSIREAREVIYKWN